MAILNVAVLALTLTSTLLRSNCAPIGQSNETQPTLPYYCSAEESSGSTLDLINYLRYSVNNPIVLNCPSPTVFNHDSTTMCSSQCSFFVTVPPTETL